ncbi:MAG: diaminopimelate epimerase [Bacilli bacterium]|nr:diaminopimelate epimerase [Bacilli bacterium]
MQFTKMHGCGNDYIYVDCTKNEIDNPNELSALMSPRHFSVGGDGLVLICESDVADFKMRMFNLDGSEGKMCGNAIRCVGKYVYDNGLTSDTLISIETLSGIKYLNLSVNNNKVDYVTVNMGKAHMIAKEIPVISDKEKVINEPIEVDGKTWNITCVSTGNPHAITYVDDVKSLDLEKIGPSFENHERFPERINTEFIKVIDSHNLEMRVYERGSGETYACGTGACASVVASIINGYCAFNEEVSVHLIGGTLKITVDPELNILMKGPATKVYEGVFEYEC